MSPVRREIPSPAKRFGRSLDQHFRVLEEKEQALVLQAHSQNIPFLLYDAYADANARLEARRSLRVTNLRGARVLHIGRAPHNQLVLGWDGRVSGTHAKLESEAGTWFLEDLDSKNGTFVNGERVIDRQRLRDKDRISFSRAEDAPMLEFNAPEGPRSTTPAEGPARPRLTPSERKLLAAACLHRLCGTGFAPATDDEMARVLRMSSQSIRSGLTPVFEKFGLDDVQTGKRWKLVEMAVERGFTSRQDLAVGCEEISRLLGP